MSGHPIQPGKVQQPTLRDQTLARTRLLDWLHVKIHNRVVFVIAEAGYGKTTLLADFSRRTRLRTLWYRMDDEDRDWIGFLSHLVAAGREHDPEFAPRTSAMLRDTEPGGPTREDVIDAFIQELPTIVADGAALLLDDFHVADERPDIKLIAREIVTRAPERLTVVFASRRTPPVPVARIRALGELAELGTDDLRFSADETEVLFRETYGRPLEPDVLADLTNRTEGWAASLSLVQTALRDRTASETRSFVRSLSGAEGDVRDYLTEEVVGDLDEELRDFLIRVSLLQAVTPSAAALLTPAGGVAADLLQRSEAAGLLTAVNRRQRGLWRLHPLLREYLNARAERDLGPQRVRELHLVIARATQDADWRLACYHFAEAGDANALIQTLGAAAPAILASGDYDLARTYVTRFELAESSAFDILRSRAQLKLGSVPEAVALARRAVQAEPDSITARMNLMSMEYMSGNLAAASELADAVEREAIDPLQRLIAGGMRLQLQASLDGALSSVLDQLDAIHAESRRRGDAHYQGITLVNMAWTFRAMARAEEARVAAAEAVELLRSSSAGWELPSAYTAEAWALAHLGRLEDARFQLRMAVNESSPANRAEVRAEWADIETSYGSANAAERQLQTAVGSSVLPEDVREIIRLSEIQLELRRHSLPAPSLGDLRFGRLSTNIAVEVRRQALRAHVEILIGSEDADRQLLSAIASSDVQGARLWTNHLLTLRATTLDVEEFNATALAIAHEDSANLSILAERFAGRLWEAESDLVNRIVAEATLRPERWRPALRSEVDNADSPSRRACAHVLDEMGTVDDIARLRAVARGGRTSSIKLLGRALARRLAPRVSIEDQGRVVLLVGARVIPGSHLRRKVLAMLCFLLTRRSFAATRDEVVDTLWPAMDPSAALNSLNQTVYFLRRVFEPEFEEDTSPGYVHSESDLLWLDSELVRSRSQECRLAMDSLSADPTPDEVDRLSRLYRGRFALDFAYEDWAVEYRDSLHTSYLQVIETSVQRDLATGHHDRGISHARRALDLEPSIDSLHLSLLRLYRAVGAHAAAAEQYASYSALLRDELGLEPPPMDSL